MIAVNEVDNMNKPPDAEGHSPDFKQSEHLDKSKIPEIDTYEGKRPEIPPIPVIGRRTAVFENPVKMKLHVLENTDEKVTPSLEDNPETPPLRVKDEYIMEFEKPVKIKLQALENIDEEVTPSLEDNPEIPPLGVKGEYIMEFEKPVKTKLLALEDDDGFIE